MLRNTIVPSHLSVLSLQQSLELTNVYLENAYKTNDKDVALVLCHDAEVALTQAKNATKKIETQPKDAGDQSLRKDVAAAYIDLGKLLESQGYQNEAKALCKKAEKWGGNAQDPGRLARSSIPNSTAHSNKLGQASTAGSSAIRAFKRDEIKDAKVITEVVYLSPVIDKDTFKDLLNEFHKGINQSALLDVHQLEGLAQLVQGAGPDFLEADDLVKILELLSTRLRETHQQSLQYIYRLTVAVSNVLDAMADTEVKDLDRVTLHEPLMSYLKELKESSDPYLVYQAAYAYQALTCVPDNESLWKAGVRRTGKVIRGFAGIVSAVKGFDLNKFIDGLEDIQRGFAGISEAVKLVKTAYDGVISLAESGQNFLECLKEGFSFERKCAWYSALRGADALIRDGELAKFRKLHSNGEYAND
ncbi:hypothetical protein BGZ65_004811 [Modicella reniformis]|uniref:Arm-like repeat domain-containing protein n=1 Tax=Modicella reniformis TaxID=1440133 RepID=A0A9P6IKI9_9FUNG|nr:hypothetical protein BGZ65_004811 [Modicella reniformis]